MNYVHMCLCSAFNNKSCDFKFTAIFSTMFDKISVCYLHVLF